jgi:hypothetical protein
VRSDETLDAFFKILEELFAGGSPALVPDDPRFFLNLGMMRRFLLGEHALEENEIDPQVQCP